MSHQEQAEDGGRPNPFAIVLGCSDSRVPAEMVFDQGLGDLFVIRVCRKCGLPSQVGSVSLLLSVMTVRWLWFLVIVTVVRFKPPLTP